MLLKKAQTATLMEEDSAAQLKIMYPPKPHQRRPLMGVAHKNSHRFNDINPQPRRVIIENYKSSNNRKAIG